jgi:hypothetical protein
MPDSQTSFWTPARIGAVIGAVLLIVALAYLVSLPQNQFAPADLLAADGTPPTSTRSRLRSSPKMR